MIFSCTKKVQDKLKKYWPIEMEKEETGLHNWYVDLINLERKNYFLFTNSASLFSFFVYAGTKKELSNIETLFSEKLKEMIVREISSGTDYIDAAFPEDAPSRFLKTNSRSVLGSMNDFKEQLKIQVWHKGPLERSYDLINHLINTCPMSGIQYDYPRNRMRTELEKIIKN
jgi:hypothetical protein